MSIHGPLFVLPSINYVKKVGKETEKRSEGGGGRAYCRHKGGGGGGWNGTSLILTTCGYDV